MVKGSFGGFSMGLLCLSDHVVACESAGLGLSGKRMYARV